MYSESDIEAAVASGALSPEAAQALRDSVARSRAAPAADEESFRLLTGFNDIFVSIAAILLLVAVAWLGSTLAGLFVAPTPDFDWRPGASNDYFFYAARRQSAAVSLTSGAALAAASWALAEYFTRRRRMALPSILLLATFAAGVAAAISGACRLWLANPSPSESVFSLLAAIAAIVTAGAVYLHWRRFHVPITVAVLTGALVATLVFLFFWAVPAAAEAWLWVLLVAGVAVFAFAMWWDMSDRARITRRSDVAFWLHLAAAPMIAHPVFNLLGVLNGEIGAVTALLVLALYGLFGLVALAVDRRALLVSSLVYVLYALAGLFREFGVASLHLALTGLVIGSGLLLLSAFWHVARRAVVRRLSPALRDRLPEVDRPAVNPRPA